MAIYVWSVSLWINVIPNIQRSCFLFVANVQGKGLAGGGRKPAVSQSRLTAVLGAQLSVAVGSVANLPASRSVGTVGCITTTAVGCAI